MSTEVENQEQQKELSSESIGEISSCWSQSVSTDGKMDTGDSGSVKSVGASSSGVGSVPPFSKDDDKSSTESLGSGGIWGQKVGMQPDTAWPGHSGIDWSVSSEGNKDGGKGYPWSSSTMQDGQGTTNALGLSVDFWKPSMLGGYDSGSSGSNGWGEPRVNSWALPDSKTEFNKEGLPDKNIGVGDQERSKGLWGGGPPKERKVEPIGPVQRRSASLTELNVTFDSLSLGGETVKFPSTGKMGLNDERSQPDGAEVSQQNREELIMKMINSNEGWGKKPIIQETPWNMESVVVPPIAEPLPAAAEDAAAAKNDSVFWNTPKEPSNSGWNSNPPAPTTTYEWAPDSDIGMWNGPPPPESVNPNMWTGPPKEPSPVWAGGQGGIAQVGPDKGMLSSGAVGWGDRGFHGSGMQDKLQKEFGRDGGLDRARGTDSWAQQPPRGSFDNNWTSTEVNTWSLPHPADQHDNWAMKQPMNNFPSSGFGLGAKPEPISKIGTWGEATPTETGLWNQQQPLSNMQNPLQQLMDLGLKKEEAIYLQNNMSADKLLELMRLQKDNEPPKGRIIRGKSMVEMPSNDQFGHFQGGRNSGFQAGGRGSVYQSSGPGNMPPQMHMKGPGMQQSGGGGGGWPGMGGTQVYGRTPSMPMGGNTGLMQPVPQMNPMMHQTLLQLQSLLQPLLQQRAQIQHNRNMTPMQKAIQIEQLNVQISEVKRHIDQVQLLFGPPPGTIAPSAMNSVPDPQLTGFDEAKMMQLLGLKQNRDFGGMSHPPLGSVGEMPMGDAKTSIGGIPNLSMDQMAAFMGSNRWLNPDQSAGFQMLGKDKLHSGDMLAESLSNLGQSGGAGSKMGWPGVPGDFGAPKGSRPPPPPGLDKADMYYNRSTSWASGDKLKTGLPGQGGIPSSWLMLKNVSSMLDPSVLQKICLQYGPLQNFYYSKGSGQALACYINRDNALSALSNISQTAYSSGLSTRLIAELVAAEDVARVIDNSWTAIPPAFGSAPSGAKANPMHGGSGGWGEGM